MNYIIDTKFINLLSPRLQKFSWKKNNLASCRCPICGDSKKNKNKTRFYFFQTEGKYFVKCHNCGFASAFSNFLKLNFNDLYEEYVVDVYKEKTEASELSKPQLKFQPPVFNKLKDAVLISDLNDDNIAKQYVIKRKIPIKFYKELYYSSNFKKTCEHIDNTQNVPEDERLVIPFYDKNKKIFAIQGRSLDSNDNLRYITVKYPDTQIPKIYGLDKVNFEIKNYCVEGPIDSMFLENCFAMAGSSLDLKHSGIDFVNTVFIFDNEPRNKEIIKNMTKIINKQYKLCIWPQNIEQKDINDMVLCGHQNIQQIIDQNTFVGLSAHAKLSAWRKV